MFDKYARNYGYVLAPKRTIFTETVLIKIHRLLNDFLQLLMILFIIVF